MGTIIFLFWMRRCALAKHKACKHTDSQYKVVFLHDYYLILAKRIRDIHNSTVRKYYLSIKLIHRIDTSFFFSGHGPICPGALKPLQPTCAHARRYLCMLKMTEWKDGDLSVFEEIKRLRINSRTALSVDFLLYEIQSIII